MRKTSGFILLVLLMLLLVGCSTLFGSGGSNLRNARVRDNSEEMGSSVTRWTNRNEKNKGSKSDSADDFIKNTDDFVKNSEQKVHEAETFSEKVKNSAGTTENGESVENSEYAENVQLFSESTAGTVKDDVKKSANSVADIINNIGKKIADKTENSGTSADASATKSDENSLKRNSAKSGDTAGQKSDFAKNIANAAKNSEDEGNVKNDEKGESFTSMINDQLQEESDSQVAFLIVIIAIVLIGVAIAYYCTNLKRKQ